MMGCPEQLTGVDRVPDRGLLADAEDFGEVQRVEPGGAAATRPAPAEPAKQAHNPVDVARLTRGRRHHEPASSQVTAKCEDLSRS